MMKKDFVPILFTVGIGFMVLVVTAAVVLALPVCNKLVVADKKKHSLACYNFLNSGGTTCAGSENCDGSEMWVDGDSLTDDEYYFGTNDGGSTDHAEVGGELPCGYKKYCQLDDNGECSSDAGEKVLDEDTGAPIERTVTRYKEASCTNPG